MANNLFEIDASLAPLNLHPDSIVSRQDRSKNYITIIAVTCLTFGLIHILKYVSLVATIAIVQGHPDGDSEDDCDGVVTSPSQADTTPQNRLP